MFNRWLVTLTATVVIAIGLHVTTARGDHHSAQGKPVAATIAPRSAAHALQPPTPATSGSATTQPSTTTATAVTSLVAPTVVSNVLTATTSGVVTHDQSLATERASRFALTVNTWRYDTPPADLTGLARDRVIQQFHVSGAELDRRASVQEVAWATVTPTTLTALDNTHVTVTVQVAQHVVTNTTTETVRPLAFTVVLADQPSGWVIESVGT